MNEVAEDIASDLWTLPDACDEAIWEAFEPTPAVFAKDVQFVPSLSFIDLMTHVRSQLEPEQGRTFPPVL